MLKLLERSVAAVGERMVLLAPPNASGLHVFRNVDIDSTLRGALLRQMQRLRGSVYLEDGAISRELLRAGRHETPEDEKSWHLLVLDPQHHVAGCAWYMEHEHGAVVDQLRANSCPLAQQEPWSHRVRSAIEGELARARRLGMRFAEVGGWAVAQQHRCKSEALLLALATYSLGRLSGGALGLTTATVRHGSSTMLRRLGGSHLLSSDGPVPSYYDPRYNCEMELLRFDSRRPAARFAALIDSLKGRLADVQVIAGHPLPAMPEYGEALDASSLAAA
jgi:hypothetical protein